MNLSIPVTNISRIILSQSINWLNLHECAIVYAYEKVIFLTYDSLDDDVDRLRFLPYACRSAYE